MQKYKKNRPTIGVLAGWQVYTGTLDSFLGHVFHGIQAAASDRDCNLLMGCGIDTGKPAWPLLTPEVDFIPVGPWNTDGLIIVSPFTSASGSDFTHDLIASGFPTVYAGDRDSGPAVVPDNAGGIRQAMEHLVRHGHNQIAFVAGRYQSEHGDSGVRLRAFQSALRALNLPEDPNRIAYGQHTFEGGRQAIQQIISQGAKFTAVMASNDRSAMGVLDGLRQAGYSVPHDIALVGFDDRLEARALVPSLTTVHYPMFSLGYQAVELLLRAINGETIVNKLVHIPTRLVIRESCGCLPGIPSSTLIDISGLQHPAQPNWQQVSTELAQMMTVAVHNESLWLSQQEVSYLTHRVVEAFMHAIEQNDPMLFHLTMKQILERVSTRGDDLFAWQAAVTILRNHLPVINNVVPTTLSESAKEEMLHQVRVAISEASRGRSTRSLLAQAHEADQVGLMTSKLFAAQSEQEIFQVLNSDLPLVGIPAATVGYYEAENSDTVHWSVLQTPQQPEVTPPSRYPTQNFPPEGLYPPEKPYQLALLPLKIQNSVTGFVAFDASNLNPCADIVRQLSAALWGVRLYREAVQARQLAEEANRVKSRFLSMVSHELRTPLSLISGLSNILLAESRQEAGSDETTAPLLSDNFRQDLQRIYISAQHLDGLIRDVLDLASSDVGQLKLVWEPLDFTEVLVPVSIIGEQFARDKGLRFKMEVQPNLPRIWGDGTRLRQVLLNLINNAIKFTTRGEVTLTVLLENDHILVSVKDTGLGIPSHETKAIFDEFRQSERTTARGYGGLGLGLAICRKLVEMHGGKIDVCSSGNEGEGSLFFFTLPVMEHQRDIPTQINLPNETERVLLLVKNLPDGELLKNDLLQRGYDVELKEITEGADWLALLYLTLPDVIILDLELTSERGWEIIKTLKENHAAKDIPVLFYTLKTDSNQGALLQMDYLTKPMSTSALAQILSTKANLKAAPQINEKKTILAVDDDPGMLDLYQRIIETHLPECRILKAGNGRQAMEWLSHETPALIILDLMMPEMDGFAVLDEMNKTGKLYDIPVVVITGQMLLEEDLLRLNSGVSSVLSKGVFTVSETLEHISAALVHRKKTSSEAQRISLKAIAYIHANYAESISRSDIANHLGLSDRHLTRCFHQVVGMTPITYLNRYRVRQAKALLDSGAKGITEIAVDVGFSSSSYFNRVFREEVGVSPRTYLNSRCNAR